MKVATTLAAASLMFVLASCTAPRVAEEAVTCTPPAVVRLNHARGSLVANPETITVDRGCWVRVQIVPPVDPDTVHTKQSGFGNRWLNKSNTARDEIVLIPPDDVELNTPHKYSIEVEGVGTLDPRIVVE
jgi:hypothetical protein